MTNFLDGPAKGQTLMLKRTPIFLRVTEENGKFDALNVYAEFDFSPYGTRENVVEIAKAFGVGWLDKKS